MELKGSQTEKNLWTAYAGESQARNKYDYFASAARKEGYEQIAGIRGPEVLLGLGAFEFHGKPSLYGFYQY